MCVPITFHGLGARGGWKRTKIKFQEPIESNPNFLSQSVKELCVCLCVCVCVMIHLHPVLAKQRFQLSQVCEIPSTRINIPSTKTTGKQQILVIALKSH
jgi:hypothetical protein